MPLIKATDSSYHGITTSTPNGPVTFTPKGHAIVTEAQKLFFQNEFSTFVLIDQDLNPPANEKAMPGSGIYNKDDAVTVTSKGPHGPSLSNQTTSTPHGAVWFNPNGVAKVSPQHAEYFKQLPGSFHVEGVEPVPEKKPEPPKPVVDKAKENLQEIQRNANKIIDAKAEADAKKSRSRKSTAVVAGAEDAVAPVAAKKNEDGTPDITPEGAGRSEKEKDLSARPLSIIRQEALKIGIENPFGQTKEDLIKAILAKI